MLRGRAEASLFLAFRPWLLLAVAIAVSSRSWRLRLPVYAAALIVASGSEALLVWRLGAPAPLHDAGRAILAGATMALFLDGIVQLGRRLSATRGLWLAAVLGVAALAFPGPVRLFEEIALPARAEPHPRARVALLTGLPLIWGEGGVGDTVAGRGKPVEAFTLLQHHFDVRPIDAVTADSVSRREVLLVVQPRYPTPYDLVALDNRVRAGGRALFLVDPSLHWPSELPIGDLRRPPPVAPVEPLLLHWGLTLAPPADGAAEPVDHSLDVGGRPNRVRLLGAGRFSARTPQCRLLDRGVVADCAVGAGRAVLIADADLLQDELWVGPGLFGSSREGRLADNGVYLANWIAELAGLPGFGASEAVRWADPMKSRRIALMTAILPPAACLVGGLLLAGLAHRRRRLPHHR